MIADLVGRVGNGEPRVVIDRTFPLAEDAAAHAHIESRQTIGRVVMTP
jgi:NADPH2:quinone reductase